MVGEGKVYLVGAGPGDPGLLTLRAASLLQRADVVVYDRLVSEAIMQQVPAGVIRIPVGKSTGNHSVSQLETNRMLVKLAGIKRRVVRLKGGDPFVFGRGSEEALYLSQRGIDYEVVPGITAAVACAAYAGIPLTHRGVSRGFRVVTGHLHEDGELDLDWRALSDAECTLVVYMGLSSIDALTSRLIKHGLAPDTPAAAIQDGTTAGQFILKGTLEALPELVRDHSLRAPTLIVIGHTVALADDLHWFQHPAEVEDEAVALWSGA